MKKRPNYLFLIFLIVNIPVAAQFSKPIIITELSNTVNETSGLMFHNSELWTHNDSGNEAILHSIDTVTGEVIRSVKIENAKNRDWEDLCKDENYAYIGDFGNNSGKRDDLKIYRISLSDLSNKDKTSIKAEKINFSYAKNIYQSNSTKRHNTNFDCEAFIALKDSLYLFSKNWINQKTYLYALPKIPGTYTANLCDSLDTEGLICGADYNAKNNSIALIGYVKGVPASSIIFILYDFEDYNFFSGKTIRYESGLSGYQTEAIIFKDNCKLWFTNENFLSHRQALFTLDICPIENNINSSKKSMFNINTDISNHELKIEFECPKRKCRTQIEILDTYNNKVIKKRQSFNKTRKVKTLNVSNLPKGEYLLKITHKEYKITQRFANYNNN